MKQKVFKKRETVKRTRAIKSQTHCFDLLFICAHTGNCKQNVTFSKRTWCFLNKTKSKTSIQTKGNEISTLKVCLYACLHQHY